MAGVTSLEGIRRVHLVGIGGAGMSALASVLVGRGFVVSGSDLKRGPLVERLEAIGVEVHLGHDARWIDGADVVAASTAIPSSNVELAAARARGVPVLSRAELLAALTAGKQVVAVSGTHGKTTTTAMIAQALQAADLAPSWVIGAELNEAGASGHAGIGSLFVVEADESDATFLAVDRHLAVATNLEPDHLDHYGSFDALVASFEAFVGGSALAPVICVDDPRLAALAPEGALTYGVAEAARLQIRNPVLTPTHSAFECFLDHRRLGSIELGVLGMHNVRNGAAAVAAALSVGAPFDAVALALRRYVGVARRFQFKRELRGARIIDDYAHLPGEITATLQAARQLGSGRIVVVFQPHRYSRTKLLGVELGRALGDADEVVVTDVYAAGEEPIPGVSGEVVWRAAAERLGERAHWVADRGALAAFVASVVRPGDVVLTMGAGDVTMVDSELEDLLG
ncbi:UDP-N-acetylmuramate/alanine ligase [Acidimicrobium ferrooxidans DSM 10331]|uniref:UDP-N-acetylmuramate--L-alanine ligase n=1 Tax=Acidimicrobium ferrooxidans (strain DSM 10331 / JCM 15462 / NBRC 103882 / ICP) TaxID=525909 RepID=C7LZL7_ACIFD|nr:UDP-N-acetylmuramate--L-alanine ligase [Acidimicrobium ferrooxidans]ACU54175.1 UDP-N-acetylmuramate/alanine ligase [Acidimicrobium ferrooxidans DSM 10331]